jgi:hypothetical protein
MEGLLDRERPGGVLCEWMESGSIARYKQMLAFRDWLKPKSSALLLLVGENVEHFMYRRNHCWMLPLAVDLIRHHQARRDLHAFYIFDLEPRTGLRKAVVECLPAVALATACLRPGGPSGKHVGQAGAPSLGEQQGETGPRFR